jgi:hypothetical protein
MAEEIKITLGADSSKLTAELIAAQNELKKFNQALAKATDVKEITTLQRNISLLEQKIGGLSGQMPKLSQTSGAATQSLVNLSRVAQDAPFGFIGIANNINPLLESFQRLQAETGSTGSAFKSLLSSLSGPAGLGLAVGVASSLLVTFGDELFKSSDKTKQLDQSILKLQGDIKSIKIDFDNFTSSVKAAQRLNDINIRARFTGTEASQLTRQAGFITTSEQLVEAQDAVKKAYELSGIAFSNFTRKASKEARDLAGTYGQNLEQIPADLISGLSKADQALINTAKQAAASLLDLQKAEKNLQKERDLAAAENRAATEEEKRDAIQKKKDVETIASVLAKLNEDLKDQQNISKALDISTLQDQITLIQGAIKKLISDFNVDPNSKIIVKLLADASEISKALDLENRKFKKSLFDFKGDKNLFKSESIKDLQKSIAKDGIEIRVFPKFDDKIPEGGPAFQSIIEFGERANEILGSSFADIGVLLGETIGNALSGTATLGDFFDGIFKIIGGGLQDLGKYLVTTAGLLKIIKQSLILSPETAIFAGIALIALGSVISSQLGKKQAFAVGTRNAPGGVALVGERGPELINLPRGSQVVPAAQTASMMGGIAGAVEVFGVLRGQDIYFSNKKYGQTYGRTT